MTVSTHAVEQHAPADLHLYHRNPRRGDVAAIKASLRYHGQFRPVLVNRGTHTGRPMEVLAGNHTVRALRELAAEDGDERWRTAACWVIDVDDDHAARIVLADNRTAELGGFDEEDLTGLLRDLPTLDGTGYTDADLETLLEIANAHASGLSSSPGGELEAADWGDLPVSGLVPPFPYFGGKRRAAPIIWAAFGDPGGYVEPFAGSAAVLLARPAFTGRRVETINDVDGWLVNTWRAIKADPAGVAKHAAGPVTEVDYHARLAWLQERRTDGLVPWLEGDPEKHDPKAAGWWLYVAACGIGDPWNKGPWRVEDGRLVKDPGSRGVNREMPHMGTAGMGVNREMPYMGTAGRGVNREMPHVGDAGRGVNREASLEDGAGHEEQVAAYLSTLSRRLERVRILCGGWERMTTNSVMRATATNRHVAVLLDPPYAHGHDLYAATNTGGGHDVSAQVRAWCAEADGEVLRIALCGYGDEHDALVERGWTKVLGRRTTGGYRADKGEDRERLWLSPACWTPGKDRGEWERNAPEAGSSEPASEGG